MFNEECDTKKNKEKFLEYNRVWKEKNPEKVQDRKVARSLSRKKMVQDK